MYIKYLLLNYMLNNICLEIYVKTNIYIIFFIDTYLLYTIKISTNKYFLFIIKTFFKIYYIYLHLKYVLH